MGGGWEILLHTDPPQHHELIGCGTDQISIAEAN